MALSAFGLIKISEPLSIFLPVANERLDEANVAALKWALIKILLIGHFLVRFKVLNILLYFRDCEVLSIIELEV